MVYGDLMVFKGEPQDWSTSEFIAFVILTENNMRNNILYEKRKLNFSEE